MNNSYCNKIITQVPVKKIYTGIGRPFLFISIIFLALLGAESCKKEFSIENGSSNITITNISPTTAKARDTLLVIGKGFSSLKSYDTVSINNIKVAIFSKTDTSFKLIVPSGVGTGTVKIATPLNSSVGPVMTYVPSVYVAGFIMPDNAHMYATIWQNGKPFTLTNNISNSAEAFNFYPYGSNLYVTGTTMDSVDKKITLVWNGEYIMKYHTNIELGTFNAVYVLPDGNIVAGGWIPYDFNNGIGVVAQWKADVTTKLTDTVLFREGTINALTVHNNDIYSVGSMIDKKGNGYAFLWKNGINTNSLAQSNSSAANSICIDSNNNVYAAGSASFSGTQYGVIWKNGVLTRLSDPSITGGNNYCIKVWGNDVYVAGNVAKFDNGNLNIWAALWKNGTLIKLTGGANYAIAQSVYVNGNDVYVSGNSFDNNGQPRAFVWMNGTLTYLTEASTYSWANDILLY